MGLYGNNLFFFLLFIALFGLQLIWIKIKPISVGEKGTGNGRFLNFFFAISFAFSISTLFHLFPGNGRAPIQDSSAFLYIGKRMIEGKSPYLDMFDHKGPVLYLIQYLGLRISPYNYSGVWLLEVVNMAVTIALQLKLAGLFTPRKTVAYLSIMAAVGACGWKVWQGGNFTEEYALPWIASALYVFFRYFKQGHYRLCHIVFLGIGFAVVFLLRANMIAVWIALIPFVLFQLFREKKYSDIGQCMLLFALGVIIVALPLTAWAYSRGFLKEFWKDYILFNIIYTGKASKQITDYLKLVFRFAGVIWPGTLAVAVGMITGFRKRTYWASAAAYMLSVLFAAMSGRLYYHYAIIILPTAVIPFCELFKRTGLLLGEKEKIERPSFLLATFLFIAVCAFSYRMVASPKETDDSITAYLKDHTDRTDDVLVLGNSSWYYLLSDRQTSNRFFYQLPPLELSKELREEFESELTEHPSDVIVIPGEEPTRNWIMDQIGGLDSLLEKHYKDIYTHESYDQFEVFVRNHQGSL